MKKFVTLFPLTANVHLLKDVGMIPFLLHKFHHYDAYVASYEFSNFSYLQSDVKGLKTQRVKKIFHNERLDTLAFTIFNARDIDILQLYHFNISNAINLFLTKILSPKTITYLKLDADHNIANLPIKGFKHALIKYLCKSIDIISVETKSTCALLTEKNVFGKAVNYMPNGFYDNGRRNTIEFSTKENLMITVGRIGSEQKATDVLCEAFKLFIEKDDTWRLEIVGPIDLKFESYITDLFIQNPDLRDRIKFLGNIESKQELAKKYESAKIFVLPSRWEGFALVYLEAIRAGCYMLCSDILPAHDVTDYQTYGKLFPVDDYRNLANLMTVVTSEGFLNNEMCLAIQAHAYRNYYWPSIVNNIHGLIKEAS